MALDEMRGEELGRVMDAFAEALATHREAINRLNVYPVPDGDTGTNMSLTLAAVGEEIAALGSERSSLPAVCRAVAHGSLMGARGNSGVILSQLLRGMAEVVGEGDALDGAGLATALERASALAYEAVQRPVEGTILTVVREASVAACAAAGAGGGLETVVRAARGRAEEALASTPDLLPVLARAGVVDAGGAGFVLLLDAFLHVVAGVPLPPSPELPASGAAAGAWSTGGTAPPGGGKDVSELRYEVMYLLEAADGAMPGFREVWSGIGDSIVVVGGDGLYNCHIHTDEIGAAVEAGIDIGRPHRIRVTDLLDELHEVEEERWVREAGLTPAVAPEPVPCGVVAVATGDGVGRIFANLRAQQVVAGGQSMNPSTAQLVDAVEAVPAPEVVILPNNKNIVAVAEQVDGLTDKVVRVLPTRSVTEGFAALLAYDPQASAAENVAAMSEVARSVVHGEITRAVRDSSCDAGPIAAGDWLGLGRDEILVVDADLAEACCALLGRLLGGDRDYELVTIIEGEGSSAGTTRHVTEWLASNHPAVEPEVHHGGQPLYPYLFGIE